MPRVVTVVRVEVDAMCHLDDEQSLSRDYPDGNPVHQLTDSSFWSLDPCEQLIIDQEISNSADLIQFSSSITLRRRIK